MIYIEDIKKYLIGFFIAAVVVAVVIILVQIIGFKGNNSLEYVRLANLLQNRDTVEKAIITYKSSIESQRISDASSLDILTEEDKYMLIDEEAEPLEIEASVSTLYKLSRENYKKKLNQDFFEEEKITDRFYIDSEGNLYVVFEKYKDVPKWIRSFLEKGEYSEKESINRFLIVLDNGEK